MTGKILMKFCVNDGIFGLKMTCVKSFKAAMAKFSLFFNFLYHKDLEKFKYWCNYRNFVFTEYISDDVHYKVKFEVKIG